MHAMKLNWIAIFVALSCLGPASAFAEGLAAPAAAARVDTLLAGELSDATPDKLLRASDDVLLRRTSLDLIGRPAPPKQVQAFAHDDSPKKHAIAVDKLLATPDYGDNWANYWRDVILARRTEPRAELVSGTLAGYLSDSFNTDVGWNVLAKEMIEATGSVRENGATALIMAHAGNAEEVAAEVSRIFLGVQIQCAQCHDHPTDRWKRQQFHELAAFFARVETRQRRDTDKRFDFIVIGRDRGPVYAPPTPNGKNRSLEHFMPDLADPKAQGTIVQPALFLTSQRLDTGKTDALRRNVLAEWSTAEKNPWFAKAFVNRTWSELVGWGFYEPIDDLGPDRECRAPNTLDFLAGQFVKHDYSVKWLYRTIMATAMYQRAPGVDGASRIATSQPSRLRSDQFYDSLIAALGGRDLYFDLTPRRGPAAALRGPRAIFAEEFGYDPSDPRDEQSGSIPQALMLMNAKAIQRSIDGATSQTALGKLLAADLSDQQRITQLYLRCLGRTPTEQELKTSEQHIASTGNRTEAYEDILWALVNSTEMTLRR